MKAQKRRTDMVRRTYTFELWKIRGSRHFIKMKRRIGLKQYVKNKYVPSCYLCDYSSMKELLCTKEGIADGYCGDFTSEFYPTITRDKILTTWIRPFNKPHVRKFCKVNKEVGHFKEKGG